MVNFGLGQEIAKICLHRLQVNQKIVNLYYKLKPIQGNVETDLLLFVFYLGTGNNGCCTATSTRDEKASPGPDV